MPGPAQIFDRQLLRVRRTRAAAGMTGHAFLLEHVAADLAERLTLMQRRFPLGLDLGAHGSMLSDRLLATGKVERMLRAAPVQELTGPSDGQGLVCDADVLPFAPQSLDMVISALTLQTINDLPGTLLQIRQALKPDGLFLAALLGGQTLRELRAAFAEAEIATSGGLSPRVVPFADVRDLGQLMQRAGFALPVADTDVLRVTYPSVLALLRELKAMGASNMLSERRKVPMRRQTLAAAAAIYERDYGADGRITATFEIVTLTGWAPHASQQQPLRPGSGRTSLADALGKSD
jgi:NADH dehydrogenase [ubiquinone] 1 alpha subcomplex assembly factor 5